MAETVLPPTLRLTILRRVSFLPETALQALRSASILGSGFTLTDLATCNGSSTQAWTAEPDYTVRNQASGLCLDVPGGKATFGAQLDVATCVSGVNYQQWRVPAY